MTPRKATIPAKTAARKRVVSLEQAAQSDDYMTALKELRDKLAREIDTTVSKRDIAALSRQFALVLAEIERQPTAQRTTRDMLREKRAERQRKVQQARLNSPAPAEAPAVAEQEPGQ
jgi:hypothetical protein